MPETETRRELIENELLMLTNAGELPELALAASLYYLQEEADGPHLSLSQEELAELAHTTALSYESIIRRDLKLENRDKLRFRGLARALVNWQRYTKFCGSRGIATTRFQTEAGKALLAYLTQEKAGQECGEQAASVNCQASDLLLLAQELCGPMPCPMAGKACVRQQHCPDPGRPLHRAQACSTFPLFQTPGAVPPATGVQGAPVEPDRLLRPACSPAFAPASLKKK